MWVLVCPGVGMSKGMDVSQGVGMPRGVGEYVCLGYIPWDLEYPTLCEQADACESITFPQLLLRAVNI